MIMLLLEYQQTTKLKKVLLDLRPVSVQDSLLPVVTLGPCLIPSVENEHLWNLSKDKLPFLSSATTSVLEMPWV